MKIITIIQILILVTIVMLPMLLIAQPASNPYGAAGADPDSAPIDGGLSLLVAASIGYGAKKLKQKKVFLML